MEANNMMVLDPGPSAASGGGPMMPGGSPQNMPMMSMPFSMSPYGYPVPNNHHPIQNAFNVPQRMPPPPFQMYLPNVPNQYQYPPSSGSHPTFNNMPHSHPHSPQQALPFYPNLNLRQNSGPTPVLTHTVFELRAPGTGPPQGMQGQVAAQQSQQVPQVGRYFVCFYL